MALTVPRPPENSKPNESLKQQLESIRLEVGPMMGLGDVSNKTVPKMCLVSPPCDGGAINTRTFIPHRVHEAIGVLGSVSVATACVMPGSIAWQVAGEQTGSGQLTLEVEHPTGFFTVEMTVEQSSGTGGVAVKRAALLRTARLLMRGEVLVPAEAPQS